MVQRSPHGASYIDINGNHHYKEFATEKAANKWATETMPRRDVRLGLKNQEREASRMAAEAERQRRRHATQETARLRKQAAASRAEPAVSRVSPAYEPPVRVHAQTSQSEAEDSGPLGQVLGGAIMLGVGLVALYVIYFVVALIWTTISVTLGLF